LKDRTAQFEQEVTPEDCRRFAELSGDWNPLHTDPDHAGESVYGAQVLHGAYSAGLISRLAGMHLPGKDCLLHGMRLRFVSPIIPPAKLRVQGKVVAYSEGNGRVEATVSDRNSDRLYVSASYEFGYHQMAARKDDLQGETPPTSEKEEGKILVTGAGGGVGARLVSLLESEVLTVSRNPETGRIDTDELSRLCGGNSIRAIFHCAWPMPDNKAFIDLVNADQAISEQVSGPLHDIQALASFLASRGEVNAPLILIGSTFASPGRHYYRTPLYALAKSMVPTLTRMLGMELAARQRRCVGVVFDMLDGGMNKGVSTATLQANADRSPWGELGTVEEAASQLHWILENENKLINGAVITLTGGAIP
jgi:3-hydroxybutyryl-CoA dehydratase